jgi:hypothetical protein
MGPCAADFDQGSGPLNARSHPNGAHRSPRGVPPYLVAHSATAHVVVVTQFVDAMTAERMCAGAMTRAVRTATAALHVAIASDGRIMLSVDASIELFHVLTATTDPARRCALAVLVQHRRISGGCVFSVDDGWEFVQMLNAAIS